MDLERSLADLAAHIEYPPSRDLAPRVRARLEQGPARRVRLRADRRPWLGARHRLVPAAAAVLVLVVALVAIPPAREAVADFLGLGGVRISTVAPIPTPSATSLELGSRISLPEAQAMVEFDVLVPQALVAAPEVFYDPLVPGGQVALLYPPTEGLPPAPGTNAGALITQFEGRTERDVAKKVTGGAEGTSIVPVEVNGADGLFLEGQPHFISYITPDGLVREETVRLAGNVLLWAQEGVTFRIESQLDLPGALRIARSLR